MQTAILALAALGLAVPASSMKPTKARGVPLARKRPGRSKRTKPKPSVPATPAKPGTPALSGAAKAAKIKAIAKSSGVSSFRTSKVYNIGFDDVTEGSGLLVVRGTLFLNAVEPTVSVPNGDAISLAVMIFEGRVGATYLVDCGLPDSTGRRFRYKSQEIVDPIEGFGGSATVENGRLVFSARFRSDENAQINFRFEDAADRPFALTGCVVTEMVPRVPIKTNLPPPQILK